MAKTAEANTSNGAPPLMLLALVSQFLQSNGFNSSCRIFNTERKKRPKKEGWMGTLSKSYTAGVPSLETIFRQWESEHKKQQDTSDESSDADSSSEQASVSQDENVDSSEDSSSEEEASSSASDDDNAIVGKAKSTIEKATKGQSSHSSSSSSSSDESDASASDSSSESESEMLPKAQPLTTTKPNPLKRKASAASSESSESSSSETSDSSSDSDSSDQGARLTKKPKIETSSSDDSSDSDSDADRLEIATRTRLPSSDSSDDTSSSDSDTSDSDSSDDDDSPEVNGAAIAEERLSESSGTVTGDVKTIEAEADTPTATSTVVKKKHVGAQPTRLAQLSANANMDDYVSNKYVSYDYADRAYKDLVVTRGKGFTKEKNKKKRGSYRGGTIDMSGGKGFKFED